MKNNFKFIIGIILVIAVIWTLTILGIKFNQNDSETTLELNFLKMYLSFLNNLY